MDNQTDQEIEAEGRREVNIGVMALLLYIVLLIGLTIITFGGYS